jgi:hypothetical protein
VYKFWRGAEFSWKEAGAAMLLPSVASSENAWFEGVLRRSCDATCITCISIYSSGATSGRKHCEFSQDQVMSSSVALTQSHCSSKSELYARRNGVGLGKWKMMSDEGGRKEKWREEVETCSLSNNITALPYLRSLLYSLLTLPGGWGSANFA